jgi:hypothetical protein
MDNIELKKKTFPIVILAVLIVVLIILALVYFYRGPILNLFNKEALVTDQTPKVKSELDLQKQIAEIIKTKDFNKCQEVQDATYRTACINNIALNLAQETQDLSYCQKIDNNLVSIEGCERQVIFQKSLDKENISVCNEAQNQAVQKECQDIFWLNLALKKDDVSLCNNYKAEQESNYCQDSFVFQKEFIKNLTNFDCKKFKDKQAEADCVVYKENLDKINPTICQSLKSNLFLSYCSIKKP